ncbi:MAG: DNA repair protein RadC [Desulfarculales bacterium]|jgi:DNA repair protein RadC|nr:DNA repair protein RadC [Desulfarculales bacterium]
MVKKQPEEGHRGRLRDKFLAHGLDKLTDEEALELLLTLATPRQDCKERARQLLRQFGSISQVLEADGEALAAVAGIGPKNTLGLKLVPAVAGRYLQDLAARAPQERKKFDLTQYLRFTMGSYDHEVFKIIILDSGGGLRGEENISRGTLDRAVVFVREVIQAALRRKAAALICAHNHPSGNLSPSGSDLALTRRIYYACRLVEIELADHVIVSREGIYSFAQAGKITALEKEYRAGGL